MIVTKIDNSEKAKDYPKLMIATDGEIVLFFDHGVGVTVAEGNSSWGYASSQSTN